MTTVLTEEDVLVSIADAIRSKTNKTAAMGIDEFASEIESIEGNSATLVLHSLDLSS